MQESVYRVCLQRLNAKRCANRSIEELAAICALKLNVAERWGDSDSARKELRQKVLRSGRVTIQRKHPFFSDASDLAFFERRRENLLRASAIQRFGNLPEFVLKLEAGRDYDARGVETAVKIAAEQSTAEEEAFRAALLRELSLRMRETEAKKLMRELH